jgi:hypothetical protein
MPLPHEPPLLLALERHKKRKAGTEDAASAQAFLRLPIKKVPAS